MKRRKIVFIGAGSFIFTRSLSRDILTFEALRDAELWLVGINPDHLDGNIWPGVDSHTVSGIRLMASSETPSMEGKSKC